MSLPHTKPRDMLEIAQDEFIMKDRIAKLLENGPMSIKELSDALGYPTNEVMVWVAGMRRYAEIEEVGRPDVDGYFKYELKEQTNESGE
jgi:hypothetical protein